MATSTKRISPASAAARGVAQRTPAPIPQTRRSTDQPGRGYVSTSMGRAKEPPLHETAQEEEVQRRRFATGEGIAHVEVKAGLTINLHNFESLRVDVGVTLPCTPDEIDDTFETAAQWVADKVAEQEASWLGETAPKKAKAKSTRR